jgi:hypothetical protein
LAQDSAADKAEDAESSRLNSNQPNHLIGAIEFFVIEFTILTFRHCYEWFLKNSVVA